MKKATKTPGAPMARIGGVPHNAAELAAMGRVPRGRGGNDQPMNRAEREALKRQAEMPEEEYDLADDDQDDDGDEPRGERNPRLHRTYLVELQNDVDDAHEVLAEHQEEHESHRARLDALEAAIAELTGKAPRRAAPSEEEAPRVRVRPGGVSALKPRKPAEDDPE